MCSETSSRGLHWCHLGVYRVLIIMYDTIISVLGNILQYNLTETQVQHPKPKISVIIHLVKTRLRRANWTLCWQGMNKYRTLPPLDDVDLFWIKVTNHVMNSAMSYKNKLGYKTPFKPIIHSERCQLVDDNISKSFHPSNFVHARDGIFLGLIAVVGSTLLSDRHLHIHSCYQHRQHNDLNFTEITRSYPCFNG